MVDPRLEQAVEAVDRVWTATGILPSRRIQDILSIAATGVLPSHRIQDILSINEGREKSWIDLFRASYVFLTVGLNSTGRECADTVLLTAAFSCLVMRVLKNFLYLMTFKIEKTQFYSEFSMRDIITLVVIISVANLFMGSLWDHRLAPLIFFMPIIILSGMSLTLFFLVKLARAYTNYYGLFTLVSILSSVTLIVYPLWHIGEIYNQPFLVFTAFFITTYTLFALSFCLSKMMNASSIYPGFLAVVMAAVCAFIAVAAVRALFNPRQHHGYAGFCAFGHEPGRILARARQKHAIS